jgi:hypothetical protein
MSDPLGLSIGTTNLVAARVGNPPVTRRSVLSVSGQVLTGFVERVGDPVPLVADDGTSYSAEQLVIDALAALVHDAPSDQLAVAVPAHWTGTTLRGLRTAMRGKPQLAPNGVVPRLVSDAVAALTACHANPGLPSHGVVALLDFGGGGTSLTLADAAASFEPIDTVREPDFSGDQLDQALLAHALDRVADAGALDPAATAATAAVGSLSVLREECRRAKEALSADTVADVRVELPGHSSVVRVTRSEFEALVDARLAAVLAALEEALQRNGIDWADVTAVTMVGGGARIPLIAGRLSEHAQAPLVASPQPALDAAVGAAIFAAYAADAGAMTGAAPTALIPPEADDVAPGSATFRALAWSQAEDSGDDSLLYTHASSYGYDTGATRAVAQYLPPTGPVAVEEPRTWHRLPQLIFGLVAMVALLAVGGVAVVLANATDDTRPTPSPVPLTATSVPRTTVEPPPPPVTQEPQRIATVTPEAPPPPPETVTEQPVTTVPVTTTTTTTQPTTTTTTSPTTTTTTTTPPTTATTTTTTPAMTTSYITVPFVPVPIPIQVPNKPNPPAPAYPQYPQQPQYPY